jgi:hypothetical protein
MLAEGFEDMDAARAWLSRQRAATPRPASTPPHPRATRTRP